MSLFLWKGRNAKAGNKQYQRATVGWTTAGGRNGKMSDKAMKIARRQKAQQQQQREEEEKGGRAGGGG